MRNSENVLNSLAGHSQDPDYKFERLYRLLFNENLYALAYQNIASNPGNCTKGADGQSIDGMSVKRIHGLIGRLKDESYKPCPAKRVYIPKKNGKMRPIGIPAFDDKLVQEVLKMILESIYEGHFENARMVSDRIAVAIRHWLPFLTDSAVCAGSLRGTSRDFSTTSTMR